MPDPSMAESPLDFEEGINECSMFSSALDSAVLSDSGHSSCDEQSSDPACDSDDASEVPDLRIVELGVRRSSLRSRLARRHVRRKHGKAVKGRSPRIISLASVDAGAVTLLSPLRLLVMPSNFED